MTGQASREGKKNIRFIYLQSFFGNAFFDRAIFMLYLSDRGYSLWEIGLLQSVVNLAMFVLEIPSGMFADRYGRKTSLILGRILLILYFAGMLFSSNVYMFGLTFFCLGVGATFLSGAEEALLFDSAKRAGQTAIFSRIAGRYIAIITLVLAIAMGAGGFLKQVSWSWVFIVSLVFQVIALLVVLFLKEIAGEEASTEKSFLSITKDTVAFLQMNKQVQILIAAIGLFIGISSLYYLFAQDLFQGQGFATQMISSLFAVVSLASAVISWKAHVIEKRFTSRAVLLFIVTASALLYGLIAIDHPWTSVTAFVLLELLFYMFSPIAHSLIQQKLPSTQRSTLLSVMSFLSSLTMFVFSPVVGYMSERIGTALFLSLMGVLSSILVLFGLRKFFAKSLEV